MLTIANHVLGTGQLSLAKFLFITADETNQLTTHNINAYLQFVLERIDFTRDIHFYTNSTIDTLDYSGTGLNTGSKVVLAAYGDRCRSLATEIPAALKHLSSFGNTQMVMPGVVALQTNAFSSYENANAEMNVLDAQLKSSKDDLKGIAMIIVADDAGFIAENMNNFLWATFTRCNPSHDMYGVDSFTINKHWGCNGPLIFDARVKPHHAPALEKDSSVEKRVDKLFEKGGSLYGII